LPITPCSCKKVYQAYYLSLKGGKMKKLWIWSFVIVVAFLGFSCVTDQKAGSAGINKFSTLPWPNPGEIQISAAENIPAEFKALVGKGFVGRWWRPDCPPDHGLDIKFLVEKVQPEYTTLIYSWGKSPEWEINEAGWVRVRAKILRKGEDIIISWPKRDGIIIEFNLKKDGTMIGKYGVDTYVTMQPIS
jgi:hypothetical protein